MKRKRGSSSTSDTDENSDDESPHKKRRNKSECQHAEWKGNSESISANRKGGRVCTETRPTEDFRSLPPYPVFADFNITRPVELRKNKVSGSFEDANDYLDVQYRLYREDFIATLRQAVQTIQRKPGQARRGQLKRNGDFRMYNNFTITGTNFSSSGIFHMLRVNTREKIFASRLWLKTDKLKYGSLICLSTSSFQKDILFATVNRRDGERNNFVKTRGPNTSWQTIQIDFLPKSQSEYKEMNSPKGPFMVVESSAYFESYHHVLKGLQTFNERTLPFQRYIVSCQNYIDKPEYLWQHEFFYHLPTKDGRTPFISMNDLQQWPSPEELSLNQSQYEAFQAALTQEFSVIQGPPGTGKTFVGLKIVQTLLRNLYNVGRQSENLSLDTLRKYPPPLRLQGPILIVCYTNHALDQFLEGILDFFNSPGGLIRVGSRCKSTRLDYFNLRKVQQSNRNSDFRKKLSDINKERYGLWHELEHLCTLMKRLQSDELVYHLDSSNLHVSPPFLPKGSLKEWLHDSTSDTSDQVKQQIAEFLQWQASVFAHKKAATTANHIDTGTKEREAKLEDDETNCRGVTLDQSWDHINWSALGENVMSDNQAQQYIGDRPFFTVTSNDSLSDFPLTVRWQLYRYWFCKFLKAVHAGMIQCQEKFKTKLCQRKEMKEQEDVELLRKAKVIGMTTTGAARMQSVLQQVGPEIVIVEEAAEVLEAHIITALSKHCKHLILIGDHKQLKPNPTVYDLAKNYNLDLSLFERMVNNGLPVKTLNIQHRMRPEVSKYIRGHIYDRLDDHPTVFEREAIRGLHNSVFFFNHNQQEEMAGGTSKCNMFEADMTVNFIRYLMRQNYKCSQISVITMYKGQELDIRNKMRKNEELKDLRVCTVDGYQGEESDIIIISLVRSNKNDKLGFIEKINRVCVTLSRAKLGMYVFGNFDMIGKKCDLWAKLIAEAKEAGEYGEEINLGCVLHKSQVVASKPEHFASRAPIGGCTKPCNEKMKCGHTCPQPCHYTDRGHVMVKCKALVEHLCPKCNKQSSLPCYSEGNFDVYPCKAPCKKKLACGHECLRNCSACRSGLNPSHQKCRVKCEKYLPCGHKCKGLCGDCDPKCRDSCTQKCLLRCSHGTKCNKTCADVCRFEEKKRPCSWSSCRHSSCTSPCGSPCLHKKCSRQCKEDTTCDKCHKRSICQGLCGQPHPPMCKTCQLPEIVEQLKKQLSHEPNDTDLWLLLSDCKHPIPVQYMDEWVETNKHCLPILCPYTNCKQPVLNAGRYVNITRRDKHKTDKERQSSAPECSAAADRMERSSRRRGRSPIRFHDRGRRPSRRRSRSSIRSNDRGWKESRSRSERRHRSSAHKHFDSTRKREIHTSPALSVHAHTLTTTGTQRMLVYECHETGKKRQLSTYRHMTADSARTKSRKRSISPIRFPSA